MKTNKQRLSSYIPYHYGKESAFLLMLILAGIWGNPFRFADGNNGRYLPNLYRQMDAALFPNDAVAEAFTHFESIFYNGLGMVLGWLNIATTQVEAVFYGLYILSEIALVVLLYFFTRSLKQDLGVFALLAAWSIHEKSASVGGDSIFLPTLTHATIAVILGITALIFFFRGKSLWAWATLAISLFVHSVITLHLAMIIAPIYILQERKRISAPFYVSAALFALSFLAYWIWMTPPAFTEQEALLFLSAKGNMAHISPYAQTEMGWLNMIGRILLAMLAYYQFLRGQKTFNGLAGFVIIGSFLSVTVGFLAVSTGILQLAQLQPMRMFEWVNLFCFMLIVFSIRESWKTDKHISIFLLAVLLLNILDSLWMPVFLYLTIALIAVRVFSKNFFHWLSHYAPAVYILVAVASLSMWVFRDLHSFESFRQAAPVLVIFSTIPLLWTKAQRQPTSAALATFALITALTGRSFYVYNYIAERQDADYEAICDWIAINTPTDARFITAIHNNNSGNFRARALRTSVNESQSALYWVAPLIARENGETAKAVLKTWDGKGWNFKEIQNLATILDANFLLLEGNTSSNLSPIYAKGKYQIFILP